MKKFLLSIFFCLMAFVAVQAEEVTGTIVFKTAGSDSSSAATKDNFVSGQVTNNGGFTLSCSATNNCYTGISGLKMSSSSKNGSFTLDLGDSYNVKKVVVNAVKYKTDAAKVSVNGAAAKTLTTSSADYTFEINDEISQIKVDMTKRGYIARVTVVYEVAGEGEATAPETPSLEKDADFVGSMIVEISCTTEDAEIYYTTDGTEPTKDSEAYAGAFEITKTTTVKAIAVNENGASGVATATYTRVASTPEISFEGEATFEESVEVTIVAAEGTTAYYTLNGKTPTENSDEYTNPLTIKADVTLQVIAYDEDGYASPVVKQVFKKASTGGASIGTATLVEDAADLVVGDKVVIVATDFNYALSTTQNTNNRAAVEVTKDGSDVILNDGVQILTLEDGVAENQFAFSTGDAGYLYAASTSSNHLKTGTALSNKASFTIAIENGVATVKADQSSRNWLRFNSTNSPKLFSCYTSGQADISVYKVNISTVEDYVLDVAEAGWATLYLGYDVVIPDDVTCYIVESVDGEKAYLEEIDGVLPANTAVIVEAAEGKYTFEVTEGAGEVESMLVGTTKNEYVKEEAYVLGVVDGKVGLYKAAMAGGVWLNNANKAYLPADAVPNKAVAFYGFDWNGTTGIENIEATEENAAFKGIYDLTGRKINKIAVTGIYIIDGKKVLVVK